MCNHGNCEKKGKKKAPGVPYTTPGALFRKSMLLYRDFLNSAPGLCTENSGIFSEICHDWPSMYCLKLVITSRLDINVT